MRGEETRDRDVDPAADTEDFYRRLVESSLGLICCHDFEGVLRMVNAAAAEALGYTPDELTGRRLVEFVPAELRPKFTKYLHRVTTFGHARGYLTLVTKSGEVMTWVYRNTVYGSTQIVIGHAQDITWRLEMERRLKESKEEFRTLFEDAPVAYHELDADGIVVRVNNAECELLGLPKTEILGRPVWELVSPAQAGAARLDVQQKLSGHAAPVRVVREYVSRDGRRLTVEVHDNLIRSATGGIVGIRSTLLDITDQCKVRTELLRLNAELDRRVTQRTAELNRSNERLKEFVYTVSHDLQEPLRAVMGFGELLRDRYSRVLDNDALEFLGFMISGASRMSDLIAELLKYSRLLHDPEPEMQSIHLDEVLRSAEENLSNTISSTGAVITHDSLPVVSANPNRMIQLFQNLLSNAMKYSGGEPPRVHVSANKRAHDWVVSVTDNGIGVPEKDRERIFQLFKRTAGRRIPGSGVGLAICRAIVHQHGGEIWVEPTTSVGSRFCFSLPDNSTRSMDTSEDVASGFGEHGTTDSGAEEL